MYTGTAETKLTQVTMSLQPKDPSDREQPQKLASPSFFVPGRSSLGPATSVGGLWLCPLPSHSSFVSQQFPSAVASLLWHVELPSEGRLVSVLECPTLL